MGGGHWKLQASASVLEASWRRKRSHSCSSLTEPATSRASPSRICSPLGQPTKGQHCYKPPAELQDAPVCPRSPLMMPPETAGAQWDQWVPFPSARWSPGLETHCIALKPTLPRLQRKSGLLLIALDNECIARTSLCTWRSVRASSHGAKLVTQGVQQLPTQHDHRSRTKSVQVFLVRTRKQPVPLTDHSQDATCNSGSNPADHIQESGTQIHQLAAGSFSIFVLFTPQLSWVEEQQFFMNCNFAVHGC